MICSEKSDDSVTLQSFEEVPLPLPLFGCLAFLSIDQIRSAQIWLYLPPRLSHLSLLDVLNLGKKVHFREMIAVLDPVRDSRRVSCLEED